MNDQAIEQEIQAKGLTAPRITPEDIEASEESWHANPWVWVVEFKRVEGGAA